MREIIDKLEAEHVLTRREFKDLLADNHTDTLTYLRGRASAVRQQVYGKGIYIRGLIEFTNYCKNDCFYCGIRKSNENAQRYRLTEEQILGCCKEGYALGFRTFVLQGGEDPYWDDDKLTHMISAIHENHPDCAITLSVGERTSDSYQRLFDAGADRYLLRHETANPDHYRHLHPKALPLRHRMDCLKVLKKIGFQTGCGFMVGTPGQTLDHIIDDLVFLLAFKPHMVGIGPFLPASGTPFASEPPGSSELTIKLLSVLRLMLPNVLLPATTALGTAKGDGRQLGILAGANVVMPNLSPKEVRSKYLLYDNKIATGDEAAESVRHLTQSVAEIGYQVVTARGDCKDI